MLKKAQNKENMLLILDGPTNRNLDILRTTDATEYRGHDRSHARAIGVTLVGQDLLQVA